MIFTQTLLGMCCVAVGAGLLYGKQSGKSACGNATTSARHRLTFLDNDWKNYRHDVHVAETAEYRPKYVTTRDLITPEQASRMGIAHQTIEQTIDQADELAQYADQVIVIPKFDCIDLIPDRFMLGYSIPTSHGGTPLPIARFKGRKVHLLGGSWRSQLSFLAEMGDDVVSVDNNYILKQARWGNFTRPDGTDSDLNGLGIVLPPYRHHAAVYVASVISINSIVAAIRVLYDQPDDAADDAAAEDQLR
jgi:enoyl-CoA hydratase/carnithine racemase